MTRATEINSNQIKMMITRVILFAVPQTMRGSIAGAQEEMAPEEDRNTHHNAISSYEDKGGNLKSLIKVRITLIGQS